MNNYSDVHAKILFINRKEDKNLPIRYLDILLKVDDGSFYDLPTWENYSFPCSSVTKIKSQSDFFNFLWSNNDTTFTDVTIKKYKTPEAYIVPRIGFMT